ncbi:MAG: PAS domain-containing sensor histidine kinase, partial [Planctomycetota bacterium]
PVEYYENPVVTQSGEERIIAWHNTVLRDEEGKILATLSSGEDVTEKNRAEDALRESEQRLRELTDLLPQTIFEMDLRGNFTFVNRFGIEFYGFTQEDVDRGLNVFQMFSEEERIRIRRNIEKKLRGESFEDHEYMLIRRDGTKSPVMIYSSPILREGRPVGLRGIVLDITQRKQMEENTLRAKEAAEASDRAKSAFLANMSHELKTPINAIIGYSELLEEEAEDGGYEDLKPDLKKIAAAGNHLLSLVNNVLDLSRIEAGTMELDRDPFEIGEMIQDVSFAAESLAQKNGNTFSVDCPPDIGTMVSDMTRLKQCLLNLLSNAAKFTKGGTITLLARREASGDADLLRFQVRDTGIGLKPDQLERFFQAFEQADVSTTRKFGGTGLGLAITHRLCRMLGGEIRVESEPERGATFEIRIPAASPAENGQEEGA